MPCSWRVPSARYPDTSNGQPLAIASLANQKDYMALYLMGVYADEDGAEWFKRRWRDAGKKLDRARAACVQTPRRRAARRGRRGGRPNRRRRLHPPVRGFPSALTL